MDNNEECLECGAFTLSLLKDEGFERLMKCEGCGTLYRLEKIKSKLVWLLITVVSIVLALTFASYFYKGHGFVLIVMTGWVVMGCTTILYLLSTLKVKGVLVRLVK